MAKREGSRVIKQRLSSLLRGIWPVPSTYSFKEQPMNDPISHLFHLSDECTQLAQELHKCFDTERVALIQFKTEELLEANRLKEEYLALLIEKREELRYFISQNFQEGTPEPWLAAPELKMWQLKQEEWIQTWDRLRRTCESNQEFLKHSLRNLDLLAENLTRLFGLHSVYSNKGTRVERKPHGNVVEGSY